VTDARAQDDVIDDVIARESIASVRLLAAAERAVEEGRLNVAKVLRAAALSSRQRALVLARIHATGSVDALRAYAVDRRASADTLRADGDSGLEAVLRAAAGASLDDVLNRTLNSLSAGRDVPESVVAQFLWVCEECGHLEEAQRPEICPACGSFGGEFAMFAPFFSATGEHIGRRQPDEIVAMLSDDQRELAEALEGLTNDALVYRAGDGEWCIKEIAGHMIDIVEMAARRLTPIADPSAPDPAEPQLLPWRIIEGQDYASKSAQELVERYGRGLDALQMIIGVLQPGDWRKKTLMSGGRVAAIDVGSWVANHNVAHLQQIIALREGAS
jgi:rubrerythrin